MLSKLEHNSRKVREIELETPPCPCPPCPYPPCPPYPPCTCPPCPFIHLILVHLVPVHLVYSSTFSTLSIMSWVWARSNWNAQFLLSALWSWSDRVVYAEDDEIIILVILMVDRASFTFACFNFHFPQHHHHYIGIYIGIITKSDSMKTLLDHYKHSMWSNYSGKEQRKEWQSIKWRCTTLIQIQMLKS